MFPDDHTSGVSKIIAYLPNKSIEGVRQLKDIPFLPDIYTKNLRIKDVKTGSVHEVYEYSVSLENGIKVKSATWEGEHTIEADCTWFNNHLWMFSLEDIQKSLTFGYSAILGGKNVFEEVKKYISGLMEIPTPTDFTPCYKKGEFRSTTYDQPDKYVEFDTPVLDIIESNGIKVLRGFYKY